MLELHRGFFDVCGIHLGFGLGNQHHVVIHQKGPTQAAATCNAQFLKLDQTEGCTFVIPVKPQLLHGTKLFSEPLEALQGGILGQAIDVHCAQLPGLCMFAQLLVPLLPCHLRIFLVGRVLLRLQPRQHFVGRKAGGVDGAAADAGATNRSAFHLAALNHTLGRTEVELRVPFQRPWICAKDDLIQLATGVKNLPQRVLGDIDAEVADVEAVLVLHINNCPQRHRRNDRGGRCARHGKNDWLKDEIR
mmetsp:Transcript_58757/g.128640  ORF Transcript_58757/g.128640 Transcript_58757/m.128640 type:complete len:247 (-) Transcript_58757:11-751(-)